MDGVRLWLVESVSGTSSQCVVVLLYNVSGPCSRLLCVSCHCVMDVLSCSVMVWWLMATWMNVLHTVVARFFFFFVLAVANVTCMSQSSPLCGGARDLWFLDRGSDAGCVLLSCVYPCLLMIGEVNRLHVSGAPVSPLVVVCVASVLQGC